jgi:hypothetical protein
VVLEARTAHEAAKAEKAIAEFSALAERLRRWRKSAPGLGGGGSDCGLCVPDHSNRDARVLMEKHPSLIEDRNERA